MFDLSHGQREKFEKWNKKHKKECEILKQTAIGGRLTYMFTPNGVGCSVVVGCICGEEVDITDVDCW